MFLTLNILGTFSSHCYIHHIQSINTLLSSPMSLDVCGWSTISDLSQSNWIFTTLITQLETTTYTYSYSQFCNCEILMSFFLTLRPSLFTVVFTAEIHSFKVNMQPNNYQFIALECFSCFSTK